MNPGFMEALRVNFTMPGYSQRSYSSKRVRRIRSTTIKGPSEFSLPHLLLITKINKNIPIS